MPQIFKLADGVEGLFVESSRFNTTLVSFNFYLPLSREHYAENALLPYVLSSCCDEYKNFRELNTELGNLYGATLSAGSVKFMDYQRINISVSVINDRFSIDGQAIVKRAASLLASLIFAPSLQGDSFCEADVRREKTQMLDRIEGEINDKRGYARAKTLSLMFGNDPFGIPRFGTREDMEKVDGKALFVAWNRLLRESFVRINVVGEKLPQGIFEAVGAAFSAIKREDITSFAGYNLPALDEPKNGCEKMDIAQGKLVMGFSLGNVGPENKTAAISVMCDIFGGGPYSRLFTNVREKLSLCYYCACMAVKNKGIMLVDSGVETENTEKARDEILNQLEIMKKGEFTQSEFDSSICSICDSIKSVEDSQEAINLWYASRVFDDTVTCPEELINLVSSVTRDEVVAAAKSVQLHTVYTLLPQEAKND